jgi:hypothetical protein
MVGIIPDCSICTESFLNKSVCVPREAFNHLILYTDAQNAMVVAFFFGILICMLWVIAFDRREEVWLWIREKMKKDGV